MSRSVVARFAPLLLAVCLAGCFAAPALPPAPPVPPVMPPVEPPPPVTPPPVTPPVQPPSLDDMMAQLVAGLTPAEVERIVGSSPIQIPDNPGGEWQARWDLDVNDKPFVLIVFFGEDNRLARSALVRVEEAP